MDKAELPVGGKHEIVTVLDAVRKRLLKVRKKAAKKLQEDAVVAATAAANKAAEEKTPFIVLTLQVDGSSKALTACSKAIKAANAELAFLLLSDDSVKGTLSILAEVPKSAQGKISAVDWMKVSIAECGGKGGGKPGKASGNARDATNMNKSEETATAFAQSKFA